jgi:multiple sugar transport system permease protein
MNSIIISVSAIVLTMLLGSMAAYGLTRFKFRGKGDLNFWILTTRMFPPVAIIIPVYMLFRNFNILDTHIALILMYVVFNLGIAIWMLEGFFSEIPIELEESAFLDGCSRFKVLWSIIYPLGKSGIVATSIFCLIFTWNEYLYAVILTGRRARTMPVTVAGAITDRGVMWGELTAVAVLVAIPILVFAALIQRHLIRGLTFGAIKQ